MSDQEGFDYGDYVQYENLKTGMLVQDGNTIYKVSEVYRNYTTMILELPMPPRTTVREFYRGAIESRFRHITVGGFKRYLQHCDEQAALRLSALGQPRG
jgi:hypothetical protein